MTWLRSLLDPGPRWWRPTVFLLAFLALVAMAIGYTRHVQHESDQRWCELLTTLSVTELPDDVAIQLRHLSHEFGCRPTGGTP